jgi:hypothetical protein
MFKWQHPLQALQRIAEDVKGVPIDVVMYVDRLDLYRVEPLDQRVCYVTYMWGC